MKATASLLAAVLLLSSSVARAEDGAPTRGRGWLTGVGLGFVAMGLTGVGLAVGGSLSAGDANRLIDAYLKVGGGTVPLEVDAPTVVELRTRAASAQSLATVGFVLAGVGLAGALTCLILDGVWASRPVDVAFVPAAGGGGVVVTARF